MFRTQGDTTLTIEQVRELLPGLLFCKDCERWSPHYPGNNDPDCEEGYCNMGLGSCNPDDFCSQGVPRFHTTWADVKRWLDQLDDDVLGMTAYVYLTERTQWDGAHEITGLSPWDSGKPISELDNELAFDIKED